MDSREYYLRELCLEIAMDHVAGERFNDLLLKTGVHLDEEEWATTNRLLETSEELVHLATASTASLH